MLTLELTKSLIEKIKSEGLEKKYHDNIVYFSKLLRKKLITESEYLQSYESTIRMLSKTPF